MICIGLFASVGSETSTSFNPSAPFSLYLDNGLVYSLKYIAEAGRLILFKAPYSHVHCPAAAPITIKTSGHPAQDIKNRT
jgi:hypothetical protein